MTLNKQNLSLLWSAQIISAAGDAVYQLALLWLVLDMTNSSTMTGLVAMSAYLPALIFGLYAGVMADKMNRLWLMMIANAGQALTVLLIPFSLWFGYKNILLVAGLAFLRSCFNTLFQPAFNSFIPMLFSKNGWFVSMLYWQLPDNWLGCWVHFLLVCCSQFLLSQISLLSIAHRLSLPFFYCSFSGDPRA